MRTFSQQARDDVFTLLCGQCLRDAIKPEGEIQQAVGFAQRLGVHFPRPVIRNVTVNGIARIKLRIAHQQITDFLEINLLAG
ncbi:hypothetical protein D3C75_734320 [compost metagenome]